jgi:predicted MFS family arabinose efflux permease
MLQGAGAISAAVTAFIADSVRVQVLTKAMAMVGASIGLTFALSLLISPPLTKLWGVSGLFTLTGISALIAVLVVKFVVPPAPQSAIDEKNEHRSWRKVVCDPQLVRLNIGIFVLHAVLTAIFVVIPTRLVYMRLPSEHHWWVYLPAVIAGFALMAPPLIFGEKKQAVVRVMRFMIGFLTVAFVLFAYLIHSIWEIAFLLGIFFIGFNVLEATLPNLVSRIAPAADRGLALGVYNTTQNIGLFVGGALGGAISQHFGPEAVFFVCAFAMLIWFASSFGLQEPARPNREPGEVIK